MKILSIRVWVTIIATFTAVLFIALSFIYPDKSVLWLSLEVVILPAIYIIGNYYAEELIKQEYSKLMEDLEENTEKINQELVEERLFNAELTTILDIHFGGENENKKK